MRNGTTMQGSERFRRGIHPIANEISNELPSLNNGGIQEVMSSDLISEGRKTMLMLSSLQTFKDKHNKVNYALVRAISKILEEDPAQDTDRLRNHARATSNLLLALLLEAPTGTELFQRNPTQELPRAANIIFDSVTNDTPIPVMVPVCPDTNEYIVSDGIGEVLPKGLDYSGLFATIFKQHGMSAAFDVQVADVEGIDPIILANTGETTESHHEKTNKTIEKGQTEVQKRELGSIVVVRSMLEAFAEAGVDFREAQAIAADKIRFSEVRQVKNVVARLLEERIRLGNFKRFDTDTQLDLVINELASYAAFGVMSGGQGIVLSPDARSAVPAYHFSIEDNDKFSPIIYAS